MYNGLNYSSDNTHKFKKEKDIDKYLYKAEKTRAKELVKEINHYEKIIDVKLGTKRERENQNEKEENQNVEDLKREENKSSKSEIDIEYAIDKILKHIEKPSAFIKCLNLLKTLILKLDKIEPRNLIRILIKITQLDFKFKIENSLQILTDMFDFLINETDRLGEDYLSTYKDAFNLFKIPFKIQTSIITDDSFKFNEGLKIIKNMVESLPDYCEEEENKDEIFENTLNLERKFLFDTIKQSFEKSRTTWAISSITSFLTNLYLIKSKFSPCQIEELENMISTIKNKNFDKDLKDDKIKSDPTKASHKVQDARSERFIDSNGVWSLKQSGTNNGNLFMN